jgi:hypothetical protein
MAGRREIEQFYRRHARRSTTFGGGPRRSTDHDLLRTERTSRPLKTMATGEEGVMVQAFPAAGHGIGPGRRRRLPGHVRLVLALLLGCAVAPVRAMAAEEAVLLASNAPGYAPGMVIAAGEALRLPEGASVTLLLRSGLMLRLRGPLETSLEGVATPAARDGAPSAALLAEALRLRGVDASVIGGTRATSLALPPPARAGDVHVDVQRSGTHCLSRADAVWLINRPDGTAELALRRRGSTRPGRRALTALNGPTTCRSRTATGSRSW